MELKQRINAFSALGSFFRAFSDGVDNNHFYKILDDIVKHDHINNPWFTEDNIRKSISAIGESLRTEKLEKWVNFYPRLKQETKAKTIGVITAGNLPLVGFHDFISVIISGNIFLGKLSSKDNRLLSLIADFLADYNPEFKNLIYFEENQLKNFDAIIATGSDNTSRYFEYYFGKYPNIIRKNRNSLAVLNGSESAKEIQLLADDIFSYFGLGCRNVSKLLVPKDYSFDHFFENIQHYHSIYNHNKYANNYDYNKSVYLMNQVQHLDNGFVILKEDPGLSSPVAVIFFEYYDKIEQVKEYIRLNSDKIQCVVSNLNLTDNIIPFGKTQQPELWDYADNVDTMEFLTGLN
ncbi:MAG: acyl-CoA reductase [Bacteroidales bacterium]